MLDNNTINNILLFLITAAGAAVSAIWLGLILWTWRDMQQRSRDPFAQIAAALMVAVLGVIGVVIYVMLRPQETLAEAYERSLEEEALLQNIEEKPICPGCGRPIKDDWQVCPFCHTKLKKPCVHCGAMLELAWNLCPYCAAPQVAYDPEPVRGQRSAQQVRSQARRPALPPDSQRTDSQRDDSQPADVQFIDDSAP